jgi:hypothetical protein
VNFTAAQALALNAATCSTRSPGAERPSCPNGSGSTSNRALPGR